MTAKSSPTPFANLTPDLVLDAVEETGLRVDGRLLALNSYENRVYQVGIEEAAPVIVKFYRPDRWSNAAILEEHAFTTALAEAEIPAVTPLAFGGKTLHEHGDYRYALTPRRGGRAPDLERADVLVRAGRLLARIHALGAVDPFVHRPRLDVTTFGEHPRDYILAEGWVPSDLEPAYRDLVERALNMVRDCYGRAGSIALIRLHGDCHRGNILWRDDGPHFVDFDDARMGPAVQDMWMLLAGDRFDMTSQLGALLDGYEDFASFDRGELHLIEALRTLRLIHHAGWLARRWRDPAFPLAFSWFDTRDYWVRHVKQLEEQLIAMAEPPLAV